MQDFGRGLPRVWLCHADRQHDLLRDRVPGRENAGTAAQRGPLLDEALAEEHRLHAPRDRLQDGSVRRAGSLLGSLFCQQDEREVLGPGHYPVLIERQQHNQ